MNWIISSERLSNSLERQNVTQVNSSYVITDHGFLHSFDDAEIKIGIDGYVLPRLEFFNEYKGYDQAGLIKKLFIQFKEKFTDYIKGAYNILIIHDDLIYICNDQHAIKKFFIYQNDKTFFISNQIASISEERSLELDKEHAVLFCLFEHFIGGTTLFRNLSYSGPATMVKITAQPLVSSYWSCNELIEGDRQDMSIVEHAHMWKEIIHQSIQYLSPRELTMTLTGGHDSRMILCALVSLGYKPNTFTFGNPESFDSIVAMKTAIRAGALHHNYYKDNPDEYWFGKYADKMVSLGNSMLNIHRAHRLDAIEREVENNPKNDMILGGFMGGDYVKGIVYDDYITAKLVRLWEYSSEDKRLLLNSLLLEKGINKSTINMDRLLDIVCGQDFFTEQEKAVREFKYVFQVVGSVHDVQDTNIFGSLVPYTVNPYMDIDFLSMLFSSKYSMLHKDNSSKNQLKRMNQPSFHINIMHTLAPQLSDIEFSKRGYYSANEFLGNKMVFLMKRAWRLKAAKKFKSNFPYGKWMANYCLKELEIVDNEIASLFHLDALKNELISGSHGAVEKYWHKFTNPINLNKNYHKLVK